MLNIDIDACIAQETSDEFDIVLEDDELFPDGGPVLTCKLPYSDFRKLFAQYYKPKMVSGKGKRSKGMEFEVVGNDFDFGLRLADFVTNWKGFAGAFSKEKLIAFFKKFPTVCEAFGSGAGGVYKAKDKHYLKYTEDAEKN